MNIHVNCKYQEYRYTLKELSFVDWEFVRFEIE